MSSVAFYFSIAENRNEDSRKLKMYLQQFRYWLNYLSLDCAFRHGPQQKM